MQQYTHTKANNIYSAEIKNRIKGAPCPEACIFHKEERKKKKKERCFQAKHSKHINAHIIKTTASIPAKFCTTIKTTKNTPTTHRLHSEKSQQTNSHVMLRGVSRARST